MNRRRFVITAASALLTANTHAETRPRIAIIIDDLGYQLAAGRRALELPGPIAFAVLPETPYGRRLAMLANEAGREVLLHLPLESVNLLDALLDLLSQSARFTTGLVLLEHVGQAGSPARQRVQFLLLHSRSVKQPGVPIGSRVHRVG